MIAALRPGAPVSRRPSPHSGAALVALLLALVLGGGGLYAAQRLVNGPGRAVDVLAAPRQAASDGISLAVTRVVVTRFFTAVDLSASNAGSETLRLPVQRNCVLSTGGGARIDGDAFASDWPESVAAGTTISGTVVFNAPIPPGTGTVGLRFAVVFGYGANAASVDGIRLRDGWQPA